MTLGSSNGVRLRIFGENTSLSWLQEQPHELVHARLNGRTETINRGADDLSEEGAKAQTRTPSGHPKGYLEAFAHLYA
jgi:hypothetical protein